MTTINKQVSLDTDDGTETDDTSIELTGTTIRCGMIGGTEAWDTGLRWQAVNIPNAESLTLATLSLYLTTDNGAVSANIRGIDEDNTVTWSSGNRPSQRTKTTATITANEANWGNWGVGNWVTIDVTSVIQEIIDRAGWSANNALALVIENTGGGTNYMAVRAYDYAGNLHGAKLDITYTSPVGKNTRSTMNVHPGVMFQTLTGGHGY